MVPHLIDGATSAWAQYTVRLPKSTDRQEVMNHLNASGIPSVIYYRLPLHQQKAYAHYPTAMGSSLPVCEALSNEVMSLPMSGYVSEAQINKIIGEIERWI